MPQLLLFAAQLVSGVGQTLCSTLGFSYLDDNIKKSKTPALMSKQADQEAERFPWNPGECVQQHGQPKDFLSNQISRD